MRVKQHFLTGAFFLLSFFLCAQPFPGKIGVNLEGIGGTALAFPNVIFTASAWQSIANSGANATQDAQGWPTEDFRVVFFDHRPTNAWNNVPDDPQKYVVDQSGTYSLSFKGQATLTSWSDAPIMFQNQAYNALLNSTTVDLVFPPGGGANATLLGNYGFLMVNFTQTNYSTGIKGVKEIRLIRPGYQHNTPQLFRTSYLNSLSPFSTLRFMDYVRTNDIDAGYPNKQLWTNRQQPNAARFTKGAPWETIIALANYTGKDIWINIPIDADSMYVVELAKLMNTSLRQEIAIYIEYSNEVWNGSFTQFKYNDNAVIQSAEDADIRASTPWDDRRRARRVAKQVIKFGKIFENIMGVTVASRTKIRPVFAWQIGGYLTWYDDVLNWINTTYGAPKNFIYGLASAPYFGEANASSTATPLQLIAAMTVSSDSNVTSVKTVAQYAYQWQIKHLQYEGGPDNGGGSTTNIGNRITANRLPEMKTAVIHNYKDNWFSASANGTAPIGTNDLANYFVMSGNVSRYGCWGATEDLNYLQNLSNAPKYDALCVLTGMCGNTPAVALTAPANNTKVVANSSVTISATATDVDGTVKKVEFFIGSTLMGVDSIAPYSITWIPVKLGIVGILVKAIDNSGKFTFTNANAIEVISNASGVMEEEPKMSFSVYPVPANNSLSISFSNGRLPNSKIEIRDLSGKLLLLQSVTTHEMKLDVSDLSNGMYFMVMALENGKTITKEVMISR